MDPAQHVDDSMIQHADDQTQQRSLGSRPSKNLLLLLGKMWRQSGASPLADAEARRSYHDEKMNDENDRSMMGDSSNSFYSNKLRSHRGKESEVSYENGDSQDFFRMPY